MRAIVYAPNRFDQLFFAMAADAAPADVVVEFVATADQLMAALDAAMTDGWLPDVVLVHTDGTGSGLGAIERIDRDPILWPTPTVVVSDDPNDEERFGAYAVGAHWYEPMPAGLSFAVELLDRLPGRLAAASAAIDRDGVIDLAAAELMLEIEAFLLDGDSVDD